MHFLDLTTRKLFFDVEIQPNQSKHNTDRLAVMVCGLYGERVHNVLKDKSGPTHRVNVNLIVRNPYVLHIESKSTERTKADAQEIGDK